MSIHAQMSQEAQAKMQKQKRVSSISSISSILIAILSLFLVGLILFVIAMNIQTETKEEIIAFTTSDVLEEVVDDPKIENQVEREPVQPSSVSKDIVADLASPVAVTTLEEFETPPDLTVDFGDTEDFGDISFASEEAISNQKEMFTAFGKTGTDGLVGYYYDLRYKAGTIGKDIEPVLTSIGKECADGAFYAPVPLFQEKLYDNGFARRSLKKYFKSSIPMIFTNLFFPDSASTAAIEAFNLEGLVEIAPNNVSYIVKYEGRITQTPEDKEFRFVGNFDNVLVVYLNGELVYGAAECKAPSGGSSLTLPDQVETKLRLFNRKLTAGPYIKIRKGDKLTIVVGEHGGSIGGGLFIQEKDKKYKTKHGFPILPIFALEELTDKDKKRMLKDGFPVEVEDIPIFKAKKL